MRNFLQDSRQKVYWVSQLSGWGGYSLLNLLIVLSARADGNISESTDRFLYLIIPTLTISGILFTHIYREIIRIYGWAELEPRALAPRVFLGSITVAILIFLLVMAFFLLAGESVRELFTLPNILINWINLSIIVLLWSILYFAIHFFENFQKVEIERLIWEAAVKDFELKALKSQLNPHFMFNAMNGIRALIEEDPEKAKKSITQLSNIFRYSLNIERSETVPLEDEIRTVNDYLSLEQVRYEERLRFLIEVDPSVNFVEIPPMMVQTLVENGIKHGVSKLPKGGEVQIRAYKEKDDLVLIILNSGSLDDKLMADSKGFGLANTKNRLSILYGEKASFTISESDGKVRAEIKIPTGGIENESYYR
ncbi:MAG: histidine kinase [Ignavibacteria bacterium]|nr:histidine kinase [Ignavibacteria bacterium]